MHPKRIIIAISGSSGIIYGIRLLQTLKKLPIETHLIVSQAAKLTQKYESALSIDDIKELATVVHNNNNIGASIASGSFQTLGMIVAPCSMKTLAEIANGIGGNLISRAADVVLKERRRLVLVPRETPLHLGHLQNMTQITQIGGIIFPPVPAFYNNPKSIQDLVDDNVGRILDLFDLDTNLVRRWEG